MHPHIAHLSRDKKLKKIIDSHGELLLRKKKNVAIRLCASIMSQQLSVKVASVIFKRFLELYNGKEPTPQQIVDTPDITLRNIGLSNAKVQYVKNVAHFALVNRMDHRYFSSQSNNDIIAYLTPIKGVGRWTVEMLLMFTLGREDVFATDDLGIQQAMTGIYNINSSNKKQLIEEMKKISLRWSPYRSYACLYLWRWKDNPPI